MQNEPMPLSKKSVVIIASIICVIVIGTISYLLFHDTTPKVHKNTNNIKKEIDDTKSKTTNIAANNKTKDIPSGPDADSDIPSSVDTPNTKRRPLRAGLPDSNIPDPLFVSLPPLTPDIQPPEIIPDNSSSGGSIKPGENLPPTVTDKPSNPDNPEVSPTIDLSAPSAITLHIDSLFSAKDYVSATSSDGKDINGFIYSNSNLDIHTEGHYLVVYFVSYKGVTLSCQMNVNVINDAPRFKGTEDISVEIMTSFDPDLGVSVTDREDGTLPYTLSGTVDTTIPGVYHLTYTASDKHGKTTEISRSITVFAEKPVFTGTDNQIIDAGTSFDPHAGVSVADKYDVVTYNIEGSVDTSTVGTYTFTYSSTNKYSVTTTIVRTITVTADKPHFTGIIDITIPLGFSFDPRSGITVSDKYGTNTYTVGGSVDNTLSGTYTLTYTATNKYGASTTQTRIITVEEQSQETL